MSHRFLKTKKSTDKKVYKPKNLQADDNAADVGELLDLCSGQFSPKKLCSQERKSAKNLFGTQPEEEAMDDLANLCSGTFAESRKSEAESDGIFQSGRNRLKGIFGSHVENSSQQNMDNLAGLCSGTFSAEVSSI